MMTRVEGSSLPVVSVPLRTSYGSEKRQRTIEPPLLDVDCLTMSRVDIFKRLSALCLSKRIVDYL